MHWDEGGVFLQGWEGFGLLVGWRGIVLANLDVGLEDVGKLLLAGSDMMEKMRTWYDRD